MTQEQLIDLKTETLRTFEAIVAFLATIHCADEDTLALNYKRQLAVALVDLKRATEKLP